MEQRWQCYEPGVEGIFSELVVDTDDDGPEEALVSWTQGTNCHLSVVNANFYVANDFAAKGAEPDSRNATRSSTSGLHPLGVLRPDETRDGGKRIVASLGTAHGGKPRAFCGFDYNSKRPLWETEVAPPLNSLEVIDLNGDGFKDFVCGSQAVCNGNNLGDQDDSHAYVFAFSDAGKLLWQTNLAGSLCGVKVLAADIEGNGKHQLLAWVDPSEIYHATNRHGLGKIARMDYDGNVLKTYEPGICFRSCLAVDLNDDGRPEILLSDCEGAIHVLDSNLRLSRKVQVFDGGTRRPRSIDRIDFRLIKQARLLPNGKPQIVAQACMIRQDTMKNLGRYDKPSDKIWSEKLEVLLLDTQLKPAAVYHVANAAPSGFGVNVRVADMDGSGLDQIVLLSDHVEILKLRKRGW